MKPGLDEMLQRPTENGSNAAEELEVLGFELGQLQRSARDRGLPIIVLFEGWEAAGKGTLINRLAMTLDPRGYRVLTVESATAQERLRSPLYRYWRDLPEPGRFVLYDRSWYDGIWRGLAEGELGKSKLRNACADVRAFEQTLIDHGYLLSKFFLHITKKEQERRFRELQRDRSTSWRIDSQDLRQHRGYNRWRRSIEKVMDKTCSPPLGSFYVVDAEHRQEAALLVFRELRRVLSARLDQTAFSMASAVGETHAAPVTTNGSEETSVSDTRITSGPNALSEVDLNQRLDAAEYALELAQLKDQLREIEHRIYKKRVGVIIGFEGWDAAGKGGSIRRLVSTLDPRGYEVIPISAPTAHEASMHYLWRFAQRLPKGGHIAIFDRTWYGRVLVERVEGFTPEIQWRMAYDEIRAFENHLVRSGNVLVKFWLHIDAEEQLRRFQAREQTPEKKWKITAEDWRNREKRPLYEAAVADMIELTSTGECPWTIVAANDKPFARIATMKAVAGAIASRLKR